MANHRLLYALFWTNEVIVATGYDQSQQRGGFSFKERERLRTFDNEKMANKEVLTYANNAVLKCFKKS